MDAGDLTYCSGSFCYGLAAINIIFSVLTIPENVIVLIALSRLSKARTWKVPNILMASLATTDLLSGCIAQSLYGYFLFKQGGRFDEDDIQGADFGLLLVLNYSSYTLCGASLLLVAIMSVDRLLAILHPISYKANKYRNKIVSSIVVAWLFCLSIPILRFVSSETVSPFVYIISGVMVLPIAAIFVSYTIVIYLFVSLGKQRIFSTSEGRTRQSLGDSQVAPIAVSIPETTSSQVKQLTKSFAVIAATLVIMYLPQLIIKPLMLNASEDLRKYPVSLEDLANTLLYCNSFVNPLIYAYRHKGIRNELKAMFQNTQTRSSRAPSSPYYQRKGASSDMCSSTGSGVSQTTNKHTFVVSQVVDTNV